MISKLFFTVCCIFLVTKTGAQVLRNYIRLEKPDYCSTDTIRAKSFLGRKVKIWNGGGVYPTLNLGESFKGLPDEWRKKGGINGWQNYKPHAGDTGTIVHFLGSEKKGSNQIYLLKIGDNYVPVSCSDLTNEDLLENNMQNRPGNNIQIRPLINI